MMEGRCWRALKLFMLVACGASVAILIITVEAKHREEKRSIRSASHGKI